MRHLSDCVEGIYLMREKYLLILRYIGLSVLQKIISESC
jgi:hypothetical protein